MKTFSYLNCLHEQMNEKRTMGSEKPHQLTSVGELVFMAPPTLVCDGQRESDSVQFVFLYFICGENKSTLRLLTKKQELRKKCLERTLPLFTFKRPGRGGPGAAARARWRAPRFNTGRRAASGLS